MIPLAIAHEIKHLFEVDDLSFISVGGGSINEAFSFHIGNQKYFLKYNLDFKLPNIIKYEVEGLKAIASSNTIKTPQIIHQAQIDDFEVLILGFIESQIPTKDYWIDFGKQLAAMHLSGNNNQFGWHHDNYLGSLAQENKWNDAFIPFWINHRIRPQLKIAFEKSLVSSKDLKSFDRLFKRLGEILPKMKPALVHGDLWSGNFIANNNVGPVLIDPAIHYSAAETDIAFTHLFGGFAPDFYEAYFEANPFEEGFNERIKIYNLYPLLLHLNLFGSTYYSAIAKSIKSFWE